MITPGTAELAIAVAKGLVKFAGQLDRLLAEKVAVQSPLALKLPAVNFSPGPGVLKPRLTACVAETSDDQPGPLGRKRRAQLAALMSSPTPDLAEMRRFYALAFPDEALRDSKTIQPDDNFLRFLRDALPGMRESLPENTDTRDREKAETYRAAVLCAAFSVDSGEDTRQLGYPVRIGLLVTDVLAELGAEHTQLFIKDERFRLVAQNVLRRFAKPDLEEFDEWSPILRHTLSATLNGALDARAAWSSQSPWLNVILDSLAEAREAAGDEGDNFLLGLVRGEGYPLLLEQALGQAALRLDAADAPVFQKIAAEFLRQAAPLVSKDPKNFGPFFNAHWGNLLQVAFVAVDKHGSAVLEGASPLLQEALLASIHALAETPGSQLVSRDTLFHVADGILGVAATRPDLWAQDIQRPWLAEFLQSIARTLDRQGAARSLSREGLESVVRDASSRFAEHPEWIVQEPGLFQKIVAGALEQVSGLPALEGKGLAQALVQGTLESMAKNPSLLGTKFPEALADFAGELSTQLKERSLSSVRAAHLIDAAAGAVARHPELFARNESPLAATIFQAVIRAAKSDASGVLSLAGIDAITRELFVVFAQRGRDAADQKASNLRDRLTEVLQAGLARAREEMGRRLDVPALPKVLASLVGLWLSGEIQNIDPDDAGFQRAFAELAEQEITA